ncbi:hypothetical protein LTR91_026846, partial [Friedmanniomyces endolithicus]
TTYEMLPSDSYSATSQAIRFYSTQKKRPTLSVHYATPMPDHATRAKAHALTPVTSSKSGQQSPDQHDSEKAGMEAPESPPNRTDTVKKTSHTPADERTPSDYDREALELIETLRSEFHKDIEKGY